MKGKKMIVKDFYVKPKHYKPRKIIYLLLFAIILSGMLYQGISISLSAKDYARVGQLLAIDDTLMHVYTGGSGDATFVLASSIGTPSPYAALSPLHEKLASLGKVVVYDKPGYGWSELTKAPRDLDTLTSEIHAILEKSGRQAPYILVAHSTGSLEMLRFAQRYPEEVSGILLIDGASPSFCRDYNNIMIAESFLLNFSRHLGILRLGEHLGYFQYALSPNPDLKEDIQVISKGLALEKLWNRNALEEQLRIKNNAEIVLEGGNLGSIPLYFLTSQANIYGNWTKTQQEFFSLSTEAKQFVISGSSEQLERKDLPTILSACEQLVTFLQPEEN
ncbi:alpha/beta hydrolase [Sporanaerobium hydrogeniformans]|uniref:alpha/beta hydrolase n=1 Tax=Sporanaerobium hydrogeniformans TaxID=3072179 RepID=UPI0015D4F83E|nr:alpha/beta hydrolase [Sporanaerobium hydrogeniformans]